MFKKLKKLKNWLLDLDDDDDDNDNTRPNNRLKEDAFCPIQTKLLTK